MEGFLMRISMSHSTLYSSFSLFMLWRIALHNITVWYDLIQLKYHKWDFIFEALQPINWLANYSDSACFITVVANFSKTNTYQEVKILLMCDKSAPALPTSIFWVSKTKQNNPLHTFIIIDAKYMGKMLKVLQTPIISLFSFAEAGVVWTGEEDRGFWQDTQVPSSHWVY